MFLIFLYLSIYIIIIYGLFRFLVATSNYLLLIDEHLKNKINESEDTWIQKLQDTKNGNPKYNTYLRMDFFITLFLGIIWFIFPKLLFNFSAHELKVLPPDFKYLGQSIAILTLLTSMIPIKTIKKQNQDKKLILATKLFCAISIVIIQIIYIYYLHQFGIGNMISLVLISIWSSNSIMGLTIENKNEFF